ncbi:hypothetical protein DID88_001886 [Monilinia fructigena]|uniref:PRELI/MSF1 domain-containing protein n=1 Tax=Monilinia fructigena TaxID=38457 RepID=A0A395IVU2_9HELO|nr:hypothetical protein DID88_001886 [Monilinia fructigena]
MKVFSSDCKFDYSWEEVSTANWRKYCPWNEKSTHVIAVDTLSRYVDAETGILRTERLITCKQTAPKWLQSLMGGKDTSHVFETSYVDPVTKKITALCGGWQKVKNAVEDATVTAFSDNARKGKEGFEAVLAMSRRVFSEEKLRQQQAAAMA